jgi:hypothetical protein
MSTIITLLLLALAAYGLLAAGLYVAQERLLFLPDRVVTGSPANAGLTHEEVTLVAADGVRLHGWYVPHPAARGALLFLHGNAGDIGDRIATLALLHRLRVDLLIIDYRGYGRSTGKPGEAGTYLDAAAAWDELRRRGHAAERIIVHGRSLGGAVAARLAADAAPAGLVLEATFSSLAELAAELYPWLPVRPLLRLHYPTAADAARYPGPVLIVHAADDEIIGFAHAERLLRAVQPRGHLVRLEGGHNAAFLVSGRRYLEALEQFLDAALRE